MKEEPCLRKESLRFAINKLRHEKEYLEKKARADKFFEAIKEGKLCVISNMNHHIVKEEKQDEY